MMGVFIAFEGVDGSGKSTQAELLADRLKNNEINVYRTMEPTEGPMGKLLRRYLSRDLHADESALSALFAADRLDHVLSPDTGIRNMLLNGINILTDRFYLSSIAYQSIALPMDWVISVNSLCMSICKPDLHVFLDVAPETAFERVRQRKGNLDIYETRENICAIRKKYFEAFKLLNKKENIAIIDANASPDVVSDRVYTSVSRFFNI